MRAMTDTHTEMQTLYDRIYSLWLRVPAPITADHESKCRPAELVGSARRSSAAGWFIRNFGNKHHARAGRKRRSAAVCRAGVGAIHGSNWCTEWRITYIPFTAPSTPGSNSN
jgi:hypothetical protein